MLVILKNLYRQTDKKIIALTILFIVLPIFILRFLGLLQPIELTTYDLLFHLSSRESKDERIVLVTWTESDIQITEEDTMSDRSLSFVLETVKAQQPRLIGLDLYRDVPRASHVLTSQENKAAYNRLQEIFRTTENLFAVEKVRKPIIKTSKILSEQKKVACSDLINDFDNYVRRAFIDCQPIIENGEVPVYGTSYYLGTVLGLKYLEMEGWKIADADTSSSTDSLKFFKSNRAKILEDLGVFHGPYIDNHIGTDFLINWRRNKNPFLEISVSQINAGLVESDFFRDKIVIIGNTASSTADRHQIPTARWNAKLGWVYGVYIPAHITSSIVSAGLEGRPLIEMAPGYIDYWLLVTLPFLIVLAIARCHELELIKLFLISIFVGIITTLLLSVISLEAFQFGIVIPIVPAILSVWGSIILVNNHIQFEKERENYFKLKTFTENLNHNMRATITSIKGSTNIIKEEFSFFEALELSTKKRESKAKIDEINSFINKILNKVELSINYIDKTSTYIKRDEISRQSLQLSEVNRTIEQIAKETYNLYLKQKPINCLIREEYDPTLENELINYYCIKAVISNLLSNAFTAINMQKKRLEKQKYIPIIYISTKNERKFIKIIIEDNGVGIPLNRQNEIFKPLTSYTLGQGIGLNIVEDFLNMEKGQISFKSIEGKGTKFTVLIPKKKQIIAS